MAWINGNVENEMLMAKWKNEIIMKKLMKSNQWNEIRKYEKMNKKIMWND